MIPFADSYFDALDEINEAKKAGEKLAAHPSGEVRVELKTESSTEELVLPPAVLRVLVRALSEMAQGNAVTLDRKSVV